MKKTPFIIVSAIFLIGIKSDNLYSASDEGDEIKKKIFSIEEEITFLEKEILRDREIASWVQNNIALGNTRDILKRDLSEKGRILENLKKNAYVDFKNEIDFIEQNIEKEREIVSGIRIDIGTIKYTQAYIQETIPKKDNLLNVFKERLEELKVKLDSLKKESVE
jgi:hypothetical protein